MNFNFTQLKSTARRAAAILLAVLLCACLLGANAATGAFASASGDASGNASGNAPVQCDHTWSTERTIDKASTCTEKGISSIHCKNCDAVKPGSEESIPMLAHKNSFVKKTAGVCKDGYQYYLCTACGKKTSYKTLPGYSANYLKNFSVSAGRKSFTAKWTKQSKANQAKYTGFQIRYSTSSTMTKVKTVSVSKSSASKTIKKLTAKKRYYIQGRTYTKKNGKTYYSSWGAKKSVVTKK